MHGSTFECPTDRSVAFTRRRRAAWWTRIALLLAIIIPSSAIVSGARATPRDAERGAGSVSGDVSGDEEVDEEVDELTVEPDELDEREVWAGEVAGERASLVMTPREATVDGVFFQWRGPVDPALRAVGGSAVITREGMRLAANFKLEDGRTPMVQLEVPDTGIWKIEVIPPVVDAATVFAKPISFSITAGESRVEEPVRRRAIRRFFRRPEVRYTIMGVGCFVTAIGIIVYRYRR